MLPDPGLVPAAVKNSLIISVLIGEGDSVVRLERKADVAGERARSKLALDMRINSAALLLNI